MSEKERNEWKDRVRASATDPKLTSMRFTLAHRTADVFREVGDELHVAGLLLGTDRLQGKSKGGHGSDAVVAVSLLLRLAGQLMSAIADLFKDGRHYAGAALLRQVVEVEYLAWAFEARDQDAERWLRSNRDERMEFFWPAKLRKAAQGRFPAKDYRLHCEMGGHPVPGSVLLLKGDDVIGQLMLADSLGHTARIWQHLLRWSAGQSWGFPIQSRQELLNADYAAWKRSDELADLPLPSDP